MDMSVIHKVMVNAVVQSSQSRLLTNRGVRMASPRELALVMIISAFALCRLNQLVTTT